jgi:predicted  nucleic acid-binding Zn-ribbon protein
LLSVELVELAREDAKLFQLKQQIDSIPGRLADLQRQATRVERDIRDTETIFEKLEKERRKLENELAEARLRRTKSEARQSVVTSTDQYQALLREMQQLDGRIDELESALLEAMERVEAASKRRDRDVGRLNDELSRQKALGEQLELDLIQARDNVEAQNKRRDEALERVDAATRRLYDRVLKAKGDAAIGLVSGNSCGICNGTQPPQVIQELRGNAGIKTCQYCGRILVWDAALS